MSFETAKQMRLNPVLEKHGYTRGIEEPYMTELHGKRVRRSHVDWYKQDHLGFHVVSTFYAGIYLHKTFNNGFPMKHWECDSDLDTHLNNIHENFKFNEPEDMFLPAFMLRKKLASVKTVVKEYEIHPAEFNLFELGTEYTDWVDGEEVTGKVVRIEPSENERMRTVSIQYPIEE